jgi:hypothetical protein
MFNAPHSNKAPLVICLKHATMVSAKVRFTGDAISQLSRYVAKKDVVNLDDWNWYEEQRGDGVYYIVTGLRAKAPQTGEAVVSKVAC